MPRKKKPNAPPKTPKYRLHKQSGQAFVELSGRRIYLGKYDCPETRQKYHATIADWEANSRTLPAPPAETTVYELLARFWDHVQVYYRKRDGTPTSEVEGYGTLIKTIGEHYGDCAASTFGPRALKALRHVMIRRGNCRNTVNKNVGRIKNIFRWGVAEELVSPQVHQALSAVRNLPKYRSEAKEKPKVLPVPEAHIDVVKPLVSRQVRAMIDLQILTGARSGDLTIMRLVDIDMSETVWKYKPSTHKTEHHDHERVIYLGPDAQKVLAGFTNRPISAFVFSPKEAETERRAAQHANRKTPLSCGNRPGTNKKRKAEREPGEQYSTDSYRRAIQRACAEAAIPQWHPHQLRHCAATRLRKEYGVEAAKILLGLSSISMAELYAERDRKMAMEIAEKTG